MKNTKRTALLATALLGAVLATPAWSADDSANQLQKLVNSAKLLDNAVDYADKTNVVVGAVSDAIAATDGSAEAGLAAISDLTAALAAAVQVQSEANAQSAADVFGSIVSAANDAGGLDFAKQAAAIGATVTGNADFVGSGISGLDSAIASEVAAAAESPDEVLSPDVANAASTVYQTALGALRDAAYVLSDSGDEIGLTGERPTATTLSGSGVYVGKIAKPTEAAPAVVAPVKKPTKSTSKTPTTQPSPTPVGRL